MPVTYLDRSKMRKIAQRLDKRMKGFDKLGLTLLCGNMRWTETGGTITVNIKVNKPSGKVRDEAAEIFTAYAHMIGYKPELLNVPFQATVRNKVRTCKVIGYRPRAKKNPFIVEIDDGKQFILSDAQLRAKLQSAKGMAKYIVR